MGTIESGASDIYPLADLEDVFLYFFKKFEALPHYPRSVAEAVVTHEERDNLFNWLCGNWRSARDWLDSTWQDTLRGGMSVSRQEMLGSLLLIAAAEACRDKSNEESVWPAVTDIFKTEEGAIAALFVGGQPSTASKKAIAAGARKLNLRNLIDRYGQQEYFDTVKLQFGFTFNGAVRRLPEWLDRLGAPIAVKILSGDEPEFDDLRSDSFIETWKALLDYRRGRVMDSYVTAILQESVWIRPEWIPDLLRAAKLRLIRKYSPAVTIVEPDRSSESVYEPLLRWENQAKPQFVLQLNDELVSQILGDSNKAIFSVDGRVVERWTVLEGGGWRGRRELPCQPEGQSPNLRPKILSINADGNLLEEIDLFSVMGEPLLIFDLKSGTAMDPTDRLDRARDYAIICDPDFKIPTSGQPMKFRDRLAYRIPSPWPEDLRVINDEMLYWQPRIDGKQQLPTIRITIESPTDGPCEIGLASPILMTGVPSDASLVTLIAGNSKYPARKHGDSWNTENPVLITLGIALGHDRMRIKVTGTGYTRTIIPKVSLNLLGLASVEADSDLDGMPHWTLLNRQLPLNRTNGTGKARVFVGSPRSELYEGSCLISKVSSRVLPLRDTLGWGAPLIVRSESRSDVLLVDSILDYGSARFLPSLFGGLTPPRVFWRAPMPMSNEHSIMLWSDLLQDPKVLRSASIKSEKDDLIWKLPHIGTLAALAITYRGMRVASYWVAEPTIRALRRRPSSKLFSLFRWLKVPVLDQTFRAPMEDAVASDPAEFVSGWIGGKALASGLSHREAEPGIDSVARDFLWNYSNKSEMAIDRILRALPRSTESRSPENEPTAFKLALFSLGDICPSLSYSFAKQKVRGHRYLKYVRDVAASMLRLPDSTELSVLQNQLNLTRNDCANLIGISPARLLESAQAFESQLDNRIPSIDCKQFQPELRRLGETLRGRQFLTAFLLIRFVERSRL